MTRETTVRYQCCAVDMGVDPDGPYVRVLYDDCVNLAAARSLVTMAYASGKYEDAFVFSRCVTTTCVALRVLDGQR